MSARKFPNSEKSIAVFAGFAVECVINHHAKCTAASVERQGGRKVRRLRESKSVLEIDFFPVIIEVFIAGFEEWWSCESLEVFHSTFIRLHAWQILDSVFIPFGYCWHWMLTFLN